MICLGLDTTKSGAFWAVLSGHDPSDAILVASGRLDMPSALARAAGLEWAFREIREMVVTNRVEAAVLKRAEAGKSLSSAVLERAEVDGVFQAALQSESVRSIAIPWATLRVKLGVSNRAAALDSMAANALGTTIPGNRHTALAASFAAFTLT